MKKEEYEKNLINTVIQSLEKHGAERLLSSVILTGSFGRDEPTYTRLEEELVLKSDVEIALVYPKRTKKEKVEQLIKATSTEFSEDLNLMAITEKRVEKAYNFNFSFRTPKYKTIFTYDLFNGSYTIWGKDFIGGKQIMLSECDLYEAKRLVANRIGEMVYNCKFNDSLDKDYLRMQWKGKVILAIASAWLICENKYVSSYHGQYKILMENSDIAEKILGKEFIKEYKHIFDFLREDGIPYEIADETLRKFVAKIDKYFVKKGIQKPKVNSISRWIKYVVKYVKIAKSYNIIRFEDKILQSLIEQYKNKDKKLEKTAILWYKVLY